MEKKSNSALNRVLKTSVYTKVIEMLRKVDLINLPQFRNIDKINDLEKLHECKLSLNVIYLILFDNINFFILISFN